MGGCLVCGGASGGGLCQAGEGTWDPLSSSGVGNLLVGFVKSGGGLMDGRFHDS